VSRTTDWGRPVSNRGRLPGLARLLLVMGFAKKKEAIAPPISVFDSPKPCGRELALVSGGRWLGEV